MSNFLRKLEQLVDSPSGDQRKAKRLASCPSPPLPPKGKAGIRGRPTNHPAALSKRRVGVEGRQPTGLPPSSHQRWRWPGTLPAALPHLTLPKVEAGAEEATLPTVHPLPTLLLPRGEQGSEGGRERGVVARRARGAECERLCDQYYTTGGRSRGRKGRRFSSLTPPSCLLTRGAQGGGWEDEWSYFPAASQPKKRNHLLLAGGGETGVHIKPLSCPGWRSGGGGGRRTSRLTLLLPPGWRSKGRGLEGETFSTTLLPTVEGS